MHFCVSFARKKEQYSMNKKNWEIDAHTALFPQGKAQDNIYN